MMAGNASSVLAQSSAKHRLARIAFGSYVEEQAAVYNRRRVLRTGEAGTNTRKLNKWLVFPSVRHPLFGRFQLRF